MEDRIEQEIQLNDSLVEKYAKKQIRFFISDLDYVYSYYYNTLEKLKNKNILDLGCGLGQATKLLSKNNNVTAIDVDPTYVNKVKSETNAKVMLMDAENLKFKNKFNIILGRAILHHLDLNKTLPKIKNLTNNIIFLEPTNLNPIVNNYRKNTPDVRTKHEHPLTKNDFKLIKQHFPNIKIKGFYLLQTIMPNIIKHNKNFKIVRKFLDILDNLILIIFPFLKYYCYSCLIES